MDAHANLDLPSDFDSSDFSDEEVGRPQKRRKFGQGIATAILRNQAVDRRASKKAIRTQEFAHGAPGTRANHDTVVASWDAFCKTMSLDLDTCPTGEHVFRYINTVIRNTKTRLPGKTAPSLTVIRAIWARLIKLLAFRHEDILKHYTPHHVTRIEIHLTQLVDEGKLIRGTWFKKQWISFMTLLKMSQSWFTDALMHGTNSWDITLMRITSVVMQSALSSRSGDITRSQLYEGLECLCYEHIILELYVKDDGSKPSVQDIRGKFVLSFTKGAKKTNNSDLPIFCDPLTKQSHSPVCAIKLLLVHALRTGRVYGSTLEECLAHTARRADRTIQWMDPKASVFCQMNGNSPFLVLEKPAGQEQVRFSLQKIALRAGILEEHIDTRALRRGALRDQAYTNKVIAGVASRATAMIAGHSNMSYAKGTTRDYVGALEEPMFNLRSEHERVDRMAPTFAQEGPSTDWVQERNSRHKIDEYMRSKDMDLNDHNQRKTAGRHLKARKTAEWRAAAKDQPFVAKKPTARTTAPLLPLEQINAGETNARSGQIIKKKLSTRRKENTEKYFSEPPGLGQDVELLDPELREHDRIQEELQNLALQSLADSVFLGPGEVTSEGDESEQMDAVDLAMQDEATSLESATIVANPGFLVPIQGLELSQITGMSFDDFVHFFSRINIFQIQLPFDRNDEAKLRQHVPNGNSRDIPASFLYYCSKGCGASNWSRQDLNDHEVNCSGERTSKVFKCPRRGCEKSYKNEATLRTHIGDVHDYVPKACDVCNHPDVLYTSNQELKKHKLTHSELIEEQDCPLKNDCQSRVQFISKKLLKQHLRRKHHLTTEQMKAYVPDARKGGVKGRKMKPKGWHLGEDGAGEGDGEEEEEEEEG